MFLEFISLGFENFPAAAAYLPEAEQGACAFLTYLADFINLLITVNDFPVPIATHSNGVGAI